ncbi:hypothetical protein BGZ65_010370, partial [Modicella reniformis]
MKRSCRICRSKKWRKSNAGYYVCEFGHQLEGHQEEKAEFDLNLGTVAERKKKRVQKRKRGNDHHPWLSGSNAEDLALEAMQWILRKQLHTLIHDLGFPPEIEQVAREYWAAYISLIKTYHNRWEVKPDDDRTPHNQHEDQISDDDHDINDHDESGSTKDMEQSKFRDKTTDQESDLDVVDKMGEYQRYGSHDSETSSEASSEASSDDAYDLASLDDDDDGEEEMYNDETEKQEEDMDNIHKRTNARKTKGQGLRRMFDRGHFPLIIFTLVICYLSAARLKLPVVLGDFHRWAMQRKILYFGAMEHLPPEMSRRMLPNYEQYFYPTHRNPRKIFWIATRLQKHLRLSFGIYPTIPNVSSLTYRFVQELMLPVEVYPCALGLSRILFDTIREGDHTTGWLLRHGSTVVMAMVVIVAKLFLGFDGKKRSANEHQSWIDAIPKEQDWNESQNIFESLQAQTSIPVAFGEFENFIEVNPDLYSEYAIQELRPVVDTVYRDVMGVFQTTEYAQRAQEVTGRDGPSPAMETFIKRLHANVKPPEAAATHDDMIPPPLKYGEGFACYMHEGSGAYLGTYERLLSYASNILCEEPSTLQYYVHKMEEDVVEERRYRRVQVVRLKKLKHIIRKNGIPGDMQPPMMTRYHRRIRRAKLRARSELDIFQWDKHQFANQDFTIPESYDTLMRIDYDQVSREEFIDQFEEKSLPVVIRGVTKDWGACKNWNTETFLRKYYSQPFKVGEDDDGNNVYVKMKYFLKYAATDGLQDDSPLYIFDSGFVKRKLTPVQKRRISGSCSSSSTSSSGKRARKSSVSKEDSSGSGGETSSVGNKRARSRSNSPTSNPKKAIRVFGKRSRPNKSTDSNWSEPADAESSKGGPSKHEEEHASTLLNDYMIPKYFRDDLF